MKTRCKKCGKRIEEESLCPYCGTNNARPSSENLELQRETIRQEVQQSFTNSYNPNNPAAFTRPQEVAPLPVQILMHGIFSLFIPFPLSLIFVICGLSRARKYKKMCKEKGEPQEGKAVVGKVLCILSCIGACFMVLLVIFSIVLTVLANHNVVVNTL